MLSTEFNHEEAQQERTVRRHKSSACINGRLSIPAITANGSPNANHTTSRGHHRASILSGSSTRDERVSGLVSREQDTEFKYVGSIEQYGWKTAQVPLFLEW